ncbi:hypothetical protein A9179_10850 [Pseudomonas alcaligenes]|uniref:Ribosomal protein L7/L12 C-terminal domain-containing protein n=1 Tax=Aquipseudomonas alcaligenes TaxID=43263 RepID=A0ABR7RZL6_AQUAC|nr:hypothetical protein [Pseudomonas alcaligenes]MBC9250775.1 hypothetical protein [Pseudomonas alcaligenes]
MTILIYAAIGLALFIIVRTYTSMKIQSLRAKGLYPEPGQATMQHVVNLVSAGNKPFAIKVYREIHGASLKQAKEAVEKLASTT